MVIFLDVDGVLNQLQRYHLDDRCIKRLARLCSCLNAYIVLTSSWRLGFLHDFKSCSPQIQDLRKRLECYGLDISGRTKSLGDRYIEVDTYVKEHGITKYLILDDDKTEFSRSDKNLYLVKSKTGLTDKDVEILVRRYK